MSVAEEAKAEHGQASTKVRLSLDLAPDVNNFLEALASSLGTTKSEVLRKAIALMKVASDAKERHQSIGVIDADKKVVSEIIGV